MNQLKSKIKEFSKIPINWGLTGKEITEQMLRNHGIYDVFVISTPGE